MNLEEKPLRRLLEADASEEELERVWNGVQRRRASGEGRRWPLLPVFAVAFSGALVAALLLRPSSPTSSGALRGEHGQTLTLMDGGQARATLLSDGSRIEIGGDSALEVLDNDGSTFACALRRGRAVFDVVPGGPRRWRIDAGPVRVEVVGTRFRVERHDKSVAIAVEHGVVIVRGEAVRDGVQKLEAGAELEVWTAPPAAPATAQASSPVALPAPAPTATSSQTTPTDLLAIADSQRRRGDLQGAIQTLRRAVGRAPDDRHRAMAAFTLGKLLLDGAGQPAEAEAAFHTCLGLTAPSAVAEDALARLVEAQMRSGRTEAAGASAREYERRYPHGRRLSDVRRWVATR